MSTTSLRLASAKIFGNEKFAEVVRALAAESNIATAQQLAKRTQIDHSMVRDVLVRLTEAGVITPLPRATSRAMQYYEAPADASIWVTLVRLAMALCDQHEVALDRPTGTPNSG